MCKKVWGRYEGEGKYLVVVHTNGFVSSQPLAGLSSYGVVGRVCMCIRTCLFPD